MARGLEKLHVLWVSKFLREGVWFRAVKREEKRDSRVRCFK
jgi:hypothetical protein